MQTTSILELHITLTEKATSCVIMPHSPALGKTEAMSLARTTPTHAVSFVGKTDGGNMLHAQWHCANSLIAESAASPLVAGAKVIVMVDTSTMVVKAQAKSFHVQTPAEIQSQQQEPQLEF